MSTIKFHQDLKVYQKSFETAQQIDKLSIFSQSRIIHFNRSDQEIIKISFCEYK